MARKHVVVSPPKCRMIRERHRRYYICKLVTVYNFTFLTVLKVKIKFNNYKKDANFFLKMLS